MFSNTLRQALILSLLAHTLLACSIEAGDSRIPDQDLDALSHDADSSDASDASGSDDSSDASDASGSDDSSGSHDIGEGLGPGIGTMDGSWVAIHENSACVSVAGLVEEQLSTVAYLVDIESDGQFTTERRQMCHIDLTPTLGMKPIVPDSAASVVEFHKIDQGFVSTVNRGGSYVSSTEVHTWGVRMMDPEHDEMPTSPDDPRIFDADNDGNPGVTFVLPTLDCERYNIQRSIARYYGNFSSPNTIDGRSTTRSETYVVGGSTRGCNMDAILSPNDPFSRFRMVRVDGQGGSYNLDFNGDGVIDCAEVREAMDQLWTPRLKDDDNCKQSAR